MCGIIGYIGERTALQILLDGIKNLEYRGYDSAGVSIITGEGDVKTVKSVGKIKKLEEKLLSSKTFNGNVGIAHSRWATHGKATEENAHPHSDCDGEIWVVHNGIIDNYKEIRKHLINKGHKFKSDTDTEIIPHLIEDFYKNSRMDFYDSVSAALNMIKGTYGMVIMNAHMPDSLVVARNFSPLLIGVGDNEYFIASDASAILSHTRRVIYLHDREYGIIRKNGYDIYTLDGRRINKIEDELGWDLETVKKDGYEYFMMKEIMGQPRSILNSLRGRTVYDEGKAKLGGLDSIADKIRYINRIYIVGCGTAYLAGKVGEYMIEEYANIPVKVEVGSEFRYKKPIFEKGDILIAVSQSGETADTLAAVMEAKEKGVPTIGIVNTVGSTIARETDAGIYQHIGPEIGVASTKAFTSQISILTLLTLFLGRKKSMSLITGKRIIKELLNIPKLIEKILKDYGLINELAKKYMIYDNFLYLGRKYNYPVAVEGALKLKEISYAHAEGMAGGEMKHGSIAMIDEKFPSIVISTKDSVYEKNISNIEEIKARGGPVLVIATSGDKNISKIADDVIYIPKTLEMLTPILSIVPLQLFAYYFAVAKGLDVDKPRNLAKSVTVE